MTVAEFENISLIVCISGLVLLMAYIVYDLAKKSNAGKFGGFILYAALGLGVFGFLVKTVIVEALMKK